MDPLTAVSLAGTVVQFVDFGSKVISAYRENRDGDDRALGIEKLKTITTALAHTATELSDLHKAGSELPDEVYHAQKSLACIAKDCRAASGELSDLIQHPNLKKKRHKIVALRTASKIAWNQGRIASLENRLQQYRGQITVQLLALMNLQIKHNAAAFDLKLDRQKQEIVQAICVVHGWHSGSVTGNAVTDELAIPQSQHSRLAALLKHKNGHVTCLSPESSSKSLQLGALDGNVSSAVIFGEENQRGHYSGTVRVIEQLKEVREHVLSDLFFEAIRTRQYDVKPAHENTFRWIFDKARQNQRWDNLLDWLQDEAGCYWVNGKAGSGKSTLMKYISSHLVEINALQHWAKDKKLLVASYYSWNLGSDMQRTITGMLRSLLHDMLSQAPELIAEVFPDYFQRIASFNGLSRQWSSYGLLKTGLERLAMLARYRYNIVLMIDGVDEFEDSHSEIISILKSLSSVSLKVIVSSRPIPVCVAAFSDCHQVCLHDLTRDDMKIVAEDLLSNRQRFTDFLKEDRSSCHLIIEKLTDKAEGVFLWTTLAVASLLEGLDNYDSLHELHERLEELPPGLAALYQHMVGKLQPRYRHQASEILQIVLCQVQTDPELPLSTISMGGALDYSIFTHTDVQRRSLTDQDLLSNHRNVEGRLRSRCWGLVEVRMEPSDSLLQSVLESRVQFLHRTVAEFLQSDDVQQSILVPSVGFGFDAQSSLASGYLTLTRLHFTSVPYVLNDRVNSMILKTCLQYCFWGYARGLHKHHRAILDYLGRWIDANPWMRLALPRLLYGFLFSSPPKPDIFFSIPFVLDGTSFELFIGFKLGLLPTTQAFRDQHPKFGKALHVQNALLAFIGFQNEEGFSEAEIESMERLIQGGADVNMELWPNGPTAWMLVLQRFERDLNPIWFSKPSKMLKDRSQIWSSLVFLDTLISSGADPEALIKLGTNKYGLLISLGSLFEILIRNFSHAGKGCNENHSEGSALKYLMELYSNLLERKTLRAAKLPKRRLPRSTSLPDLSVTPQREEHRAWKREYVPYYGPPTSNSDYGRDTSARSSMSYGPANAL